MIDGSPIGTRNHPDADDEARGALLLAIAASDGAALAQHRLQAPPVFDGTAAVTNRLYVTLENGRVVCMEGVRGIADQYDPVAATKRN